MQKFFLLYGKQHTVFVLVVVYRLALNSCVGRVGIT